MRKLTKGHRPADGKLPDEFIDHLGIKLNWRFSHWRPLPEPPSN